MSPRYDLSTDSWTYLGDLPWEGQTEAFRISETQALILVYVAQKVINYDLEEEQIGTDFDHVPVWQNSVHGT